MNINQKVKELVTKYIEIDINSIEETDELMELGIDSLHLVDIIISLEDTFELTFDADEIDPNNLITVQDLIEIVEQKIIIPE